MAKKRKPKNLGGRPSIHGEPTEMFSVRIPLSVLQIADMIGPTRAMGLINMAKQSEQYRLEFGDALKQTGLEN